MIQKMKLKELLPEWYDGIVESELLMAIEDELFEELCIQIEKVHTNQYVSTADNKTIGLYEQMLGITASVSDTLEMRRFRVLTRMTSQVPYTEKYLQELLSSFGDPAELTIFYAEYRLLVEMNFEKIGQVSEIEYLFRSIVPANILVDAKNDITSNPPTGSVFMAASITNSEMVTITQDVQAIGEITSPIYQPVSFVTTSTELFSQDIYKSPEINQQSKSVNVFVNYQTIEITERGEDSGI